MGFNAVVQVALKHLPDLQMLQTCSNHNLVSKKASMINVNHEATCDSK